MLAVRGVLDSTTYLFLRDRIIKAALDEPIAVVVDVNELGVPAQSAWAVFTSAAWHVGRWPEIPIFLVCNDAAARRTIVHNGVARYVPVLSTVDEALGVLRHAGPPPYRRRARAELPASIASLRRSRELVTEWLSAWGQDDFIPIAKVIVTAFVENVLRHTDSSPNVRVEAAGDTVTIAVADGNPSPAGVREPRSSHETPTGLRMVTALCRNWGNAPTPAGKTVWAVIGPENRP